MGAVDHDTQAGQAHRSGECGLDDLDVARLSVVDTQHPTKTAWRCQAFLQALVHEGLDAQFLLVGELVTIRAEQLDAVVGEAVMAGADHHAEIRAHGAGHHGHGGGWQGSKQAHVHANTGKSGDQCRLNHVARQARILADHHQMATIVARAEHLPGGEANAQSDFGRHRMSIGLTADAVGAEVGALAHDGFLAAKNIPKRSFIEGGPSPMLKATCGVWIAKN